MKNHVCTLYTVTGNLAVISRFHHFQIHERYKHFSFFETLFLYKITVSFTMVILYHGDLLVENLQVAGRQLRNPPV